MQKKRTFIVILALCACLSLCGAGLFDFTKVVIDVANNYVYEYCTADEVLSEFATNSKTAKNKYQDQPVYISGKVVSVGKNGKNLVLTGTTTTTLTMECSFDKNLRDAAARYKAGESVALYGCITVGLFTNDIYLKVDKIAEIPASMKSNDMYYLLDGTSFDKKNATRVTLDNGGVEYYIPTSWSSKKIQHDIQEEKLGSIEGYQYVLNKVGTVDATPESLFVCYFDNKAQLADYLNDSDETELIEKAIVENILGSVGSFPSKRVKTYYGTKYIYYTGAFKNALESGSGYHTEFVFQADGEDGIVMILYVYRDAKHVKDVMFLTRFLEIK